MSIGSHPVGSPPRVWGKPAPTAIAPSRRRFTPTRVGKTSNPAVLILGETVHPHACGENAAGSTPSIESAGSPPRVWGKRGNSPSVHRGGRFTPTRVGKTCMAAPKSRPVAVHPHACGENVPLWFRALAKIGSPPRVWGKHVLSLSQMRQCRFTPTRVGKTPAIIRWVRMWSVHPHACGENSSAMVVVSASTGSPPRVWGKRVYRAKILSRGRFTPTRVGKTTAAGPSRPTITVHPHACGENGGARPGFGGAGGSPPRVWGKRVRRQILGERPRFTPTRVGKTPICSASRSSSSVHPHACGEN